MSKHLKSHQSSFNRKTVIFIAKGSSSSYNNFPVLLGKKSFSSLHFLLLYKRQKFVGFPKVTFGLPNPWFSQRFIFPKNILQNIKLIQSGPILYEEGPAWISRNFFHAAASTARPSKVHGSRNWMLISNLSTWFLMASILAGLNRS